MIRVSGPDVEATINAMVKMKRKGRASLIPRKMERCWIVNPETGEELDDGMFVYFKGIALFPSSISDTLH